ncbi:MAG TPA: hypothetical protein VHY30_06240 [Verrucomicrobiae bacterium]|jgi:hypothetical protein|nr:hypothetical protein [Verrucomicrobiae bacterium]
MSRFIILFIRYVAAIAVSCGVSFAVLFLTLSMAGSFLPDHPDVSACVLYMGIAAVGFCGVFLGTLCLERVSRRISSIILLILGLAYYVIICYPFDLSVPDAKDPLYFFRWLLPLSAGGLLAVVLIFLIFRLPPNKLPEPS